MDEEEQDVKAYGRRIDIMFRENDLRRLFSSRSASQSLVDIGLTVLEKYERICGDKKVKALLEKFRKTPL